MLGPSRLVAQPLRMHSLLPRAQRIHRGIAYSSIQVWSSQVDGMSTKRFFATSSTGGSAPRRPKLLGNNDEFHPRDPSVVPSDVLYEYNRNRYFTLISSASLLQIAFWSWLKGTEATIPAAPVATPSPALDPSLLSIVTNEAWSSVGLGASVIMSAVVVFFAQRSIARISVISGGSKLRLTTQKFLGGLSAPLDIPVAQLRASSISDKYISVKVGTEPGFYLIDLDGHFYNRHKLDQLLQVPQALGVEHTTKPAAAPARPQPKTPFRRTDPRRSNQNKM